MCRQQIIFFFLPPELSITTAVVFLFALVEGSAHSQSILLGVLSARGLQTQRAQSAHLLHIYKIAITNSFPFLQPAIIFMQPYTMKEVERNFLYDWCVSTPCSEGVPILPVEKCKDVFCS